MKIRQNARLPKAAFRFFLSLGAMVFLLLSPFPLLSETIQETDANVAGPEERSDEIGNQVSPVTGFVFEEPPADTNGQITPAVPPEPVDGLDPPRQELPRIAIIIDDMGHHQQVGGELLDLDMNLTFSFLPHAPFTSGQAERARQLGRDILLHMPMEPRDPRWDPGPGALYLDATVENIVLTVEDNLAHVPYAIGVNNHMGSKFTADRQAMEEVLSVLKRKNLFFVDSVTFPGSVGADEARKLGVRTASRQVFLDNSQTPEDICRQLQQLAAYAGRHGKGIGIGHPNRATINALKLCREMLLEQVRIVGIHELVN